MKLLDALHKKAIVADLISKDKKGILEEMAGPVAEIAGISREECVRILLERERLGSTGIGEGIGIPHGKMSDLNDLVLGFGRSREGIDFESLDHAPIRCGLSCAYCLTASATRRSELPSRRTGFTALPNILA